jgi:uncharacterized repeat protein (TIGR01451 family)
MLKRLSFSFLLLLCCLSFSRLSAQPSYTAAQIGFNPDPFASGTAITPNVDDIFGPALTLPFNFCFYGTTYDKIVVGTNGVVTFDTTYANGFCSWTISSGMPHVMQPNLSIFTPFHDIDPSVGGSITMAVYGVAPFRRAVISYNNVPMFSCNTAIFNQQVILYETTNLIEVHIKDKPLCPNWNGGYSILGIQKDTLDYTEVATRTYPINWTTSNESWRFTPVAPPCLTEYPRDTISGRIFADANGNCIFDGGDVPMPAAAAIANGGAYYDWVDAAGYYEMLVDTGAWTVTHFTPGPIFTLCPVSGSHSVYFPATGLHSPNNDFADTLDLSCADLSVDIGTANMTMCQSEWVAVTYCNNAWGTEPSGVVTITLNDSITIDSSTVPYTSLGGNVYQLNVGVLGPFQCATAYLHVSIGCDTVGTVYCMSAIISGSLADCDTSDNYSMDCHALSGSYDPNDKRISTPLGYVNTDTIQANTNLTYMIRFQNTGNDTAFTVTLRDIIDARLDPASIQMGASSHAYRYFVANDLLLIEFNEIMLPDSGTNPTGSIGWVKFTARQRAGNLPGDIIRNHCDIYFDSNAPITTNTAEAIIASPQTGVYNPLLHQVSVFPNPGQDRLTLEWAADAAAEFELVNVVGQVVSRHTITTSRAEIATEALQPGIYFWRMQRDGQTLATGKWVRR